MTDPLEQVNALHRDIERARAEQARKEAQADQAEAVVKEALSRLKQLGCNSIEEAEAQMQSLEAELHEKIMTIEARLHEVTGK